MCSCFHQPYRVRLVWLPGLSPPPTHCAIRKLQKRCLPKRGLRQHPVPRPLFLQLGKLRTIPEPDHKASWRRILHKPSGFLLPTESSFPAPPAPAIQASYPLRNEMGCLCAACENAPETLCNHEALRKLTSRWRRKTPRADRPPPCLPGALPQVQPDPGAAEARRSSRSALRPPASRERPQPILTRADQRHGALAALRGSSHWTPDQLLGPRGTLPVPSLLPDASAASGEPLPAERCLRMASRDCGQSRASASRI